MRRWSLRRSSRSVAATSAGSVRSISIASSARSSGSTRWAASVELLAIQRRQRVPAARHHADRLEELLRRGGLVDQPVGAGDARGDRQGRVAGGAVEHDPGGGVERTQAAARPEAVAVEQLGVEKDDVRALTRHQLEAVMGTHGGADRDEPGLGAQQHGETGANGRLRVDDHDSRHAPKPFSIALNLY